jgi:hypothetical protein
VCPNFWLMLYIIFFNCYMCPSHWYQIIIATQTVFAPTVRHMHNVMWGEIWIFFGDNFFVGPNKDPFRIEMLSIQRWIGHFNNAPVLFFTFSQKKFILTLSVCSDNFAELLNLEPIRTPMHTRREEVSQMAYFSLRCKHRLTWSHELLCVMKRITSKILK